MARPGRWVIGGAVATLLLGTAAVDHLRAERAGVGLESRLHRRLGRVTAVRDETTVELSMPAISKEAILIRLAGIRPIAEEPPDAQTRLDGIPPSEAAMLQLSELAFGREVQVLLDPRMTEARGDDLTVAYLRTDDDGGTLLNQRLVESGYAAADGEGVYSLRLHQSESRARRRGAGLWTFARAR